MGKSVQILESTKASRESQIRMQNKCKVEIFLCILIKVHLLQKKSCFKTTLARDITNILFRQSLKSEIRGRKDELFS